MSGLNRTAPMTALEGFKILSEEVLPKLIKRIVALEQGGAAQVDASTIVSDVQSRCQTLVDEAREHLLAQYDDQAKRLDELEKFVEGLKAERATKAKRLTSGKRKKKAPEPEIEQHSLLEQADEVLKKEPPVVLEDPNTDNLIPQDTEVTDAAFDERQIRAIAGVGIPLEDIAAKFGRTVEQVKEIVDADVR